MFVYFTIGTLVPIFVANTLVSISLVLKKPDNVCSEYLNTPIYGTKCETSVIIKMSGDLPTFIKQFIINTCVGFPDGYPDNVTDVLKEDMLKINIVEDTESLVVYYGDNLVYTTSMSNFNSFTEIKDTEFNEFNNILLDIRNKFISA